MIKMARNYVRTVTDMERYYYGAGNAMGYTYSGSELLKADSPMLSSTAGTYQAIYGRKVWSQLNQEFNAFSILPKRPWDRSGWRVITEKPNAGVVHGGLAENGVLPDTVKPTFQHVAAKPKTTVVHPTLTSTVLTEVRTHGPTLLLTVVLTALLVADEPFPSTNWTMCSRECGNLVETLRLC
jgi:hypothetical protein